MVKSKRWTPADKAALKTWFEEKLTDDQIGAKIGRSADAVREMRSKQGYVKYVKIPYTQKKKRASNQRSGKKVINGAALPLFDTGKALNQPLQNNFSEKNTSSLFELIKEYKPAENATGTITIVCGCGVSGIVKGMAPRQAARILLEFVSKII
jgi:hypothetical protein